MGRFVKSVLNEKWLVAANPNLDYSREDPTGLILLDSGGRRVGKVLDVLGPIENPLLLVEPLTREEPRGDVFLEMPRIGRKRVARDDGLPNVWSRR
jgi:hypothetical protein